VHRRDQPDQPEKVITVKVADEYMIDPLHADAVFTQLKLSAFCTIDQEKPFVVVKHLGSRVPLNGGNCRITAKYDNLKDHV
jgi:hypothetical protein